MPSNNFLAYLPIISIIIFTLGACYNDIKYRRVEHEYWYPLMLFNAVIALYLVAIGFYPLWVYVISLASIAIYFALMKFHYMEGADFVLCSIIALFFVYNPFTGLWSPSLSFTIFLCAYIGVCSIFVLMYNLLVKKRGFSFQFDNGFPLMTAITMALITTVVLV